MRWNGVIPEQEVEWTAIRAQGAGGQNVNKVSSAVQLRYDVRASSLPAAHQARLLALADSRITQDGEVVIKAQTHRSQAMNKAEALDRLRELVASVAVPPKRRVATKPTLGSQRRRVDSKVKRGAVKAGRRAPVE